MQLLMDANIILDVLQKREPHYKASSLVWKLCEAKQDTGYLSALTFANLAYIMRKELDAEQICDVFTSLGLIFQFVDLSAVDLKKATQLMWDDFEDAVQSATAERIHADYIITRNVKDYQASQIRAITPDDYLAELYGDNER